MKLLLENFKRFINESSTKNIIVHDINNIPLSGDPKLDKIVKDVLSNLSFNLLKPEYKQKHKEGCNPLTGHCFVATEAFWELTKKLEQESKDEKYMFFPCRTKHEGDSHWFLKSKSGQVIDLTAGQFSERVDYNDKENVKCDTPTIKTASRYMMRRSSTGYAPTERTQTVLDKIEKNKKNKS